MEYRNCSWLLVSTLLLGACGAGASDMTEQSIRDYYAAWTAGDVDAVMRSFTDDIVYEDVATGARAEGRVAVRAFAQKFVDENPGVRIEVHSVTRGQSRAAVEWVMRGGGGDHAWAVRGVAMLGLREGRIASATDYWDASE